MGYLGGLGSGKGWYSTPFFITPEELREILLGTHANIIPKKKIKVGENYGNKVINVEEFINNYKRYFTKFISSREIGWEIQGPLFFILTKNLDIVNIKSYPSAKYKVLEFSEPIINVRPLSIYYEEKKESDYLGIDVEGLKEKVLVGGLIMHFPRKISFDNENHKTLHDTKEYSNFRLYDELVKKIKEITSYLIIKSQFKERKTRVRISNGCKKILNETKFFKENKLETK